MIMMMIGYYRKAKTYVLSVPKYHTA